MRATIPAIILAAGSSSRLGQPKQLLEYNGETLLERAIRIAAESGAVPVIVVVGAHFEDILAGFPHNRAVAVHNQNWEQGIASSIHAGIHALETLTPAAPGALILPCDQLRLTTDHLRTLLSAFEAQSKPSISASTYADVLGIPAVFPRTAFPHLRALNGDKGARALLINPPCPLIQIPFPGGEIDIDRPADLDLLN
jgi:CTP:molybdopterin cytidylyltransferase MocA